MPYKTITMRTPITVYSDFLLMAQAVTNKCDLKGHHNSLGKWEDATCDPRASMEGNSMWGIFLPEAKKSTLF